MIEGGLVDLRCDCIEGEREICEDFEQGIYSKITCNECYGTGWKKFKPLHIAACTPAQAMEKVLQRLDEYDETRRLKK
jgi:hypothetical protein